MFLNLAAFLNVDWPYLTSHWSIDNLSHMYEV